MKPSRLDPRRWRRVDELFDAALDLSTDQRDVFLDGECAGDDELGAEVRAMLRAHSEALHRFEEPAVLAAGDLTPEAVEPADGRIGPFRLVREIGRGGMGVVYLAEDTRLGRYVALKVLPPYLGTGEDAKRRFEREARAVSALDHPNIATLFEIDESEQGQLYMAFAFYDGETLDARIARGGLSSDEAIDIAAGIAHGLGAAHRSGIVHRDVKPSNVLLSTSGDVKLLDFGVAKVAGENLTGEGVRLGTVAYMSPEHARSGPLDERADLWSLGVVLHEMLTGRRPFAGSDAVSVLGSILESEPEPPSSLRPDLPEALDRIVAKLLSKEPDGRYRTTDDVLVDLRAARSGGAPPIAVRDPPASRGGLVRRLAVLPLANLTGSPDQEHLVHGVHDALIAELGRIRTLGVVSRTSVLRFRDTDLPLSEIASALDVDAVVEGSVAREGDTLAITVQLIALDPERHLWAETYRRGIGSVLDVAGEVARGVAAEIDISLSPTEETRLTASHSMDPSAYEAYTLGAFHLERRSAEGLAQAQKYLGRATSIDPDFALAHAMLAEAYGSAAFFGLASPADGLPMARKHVERALELDPSLPAAHTVLGAIRFFGDWDWSGAVASLREAIRLNPSYAYAYFLLADVLGALGRHSEALVAAERNSELEQFVPFSAFGPVIALNHMRDFDRAIERARAGVEFFADFWQGHWLLALALIGKGRFAEAVEPAEAAAEMSRRTPMALSGLGLAHGLSGDHAAARRVRRELEATAEHAYVGPSNFAIVLGGLGELDEAFRWLERAYRERDMAMVHLASDVSFDRLRLDDRFDPFLERMGLGPAPPP